MKKILILMNRMECGGTEIALLAFLNRLILEGHDVTLLLKTKKGPLLDRIPKEVHVKEMNIGNSDILGKMAGKKIDGVRGSFIKKCIGKTACLFLPQNGKRNSLYPYLLARTELNSNYYDALFDFYGYGDFVTAYGAKKVNAGHKATWFHDEKIKEHWGTQSYGKVNDYLEDYQKYYCVSKAVKDAFDKAYPNYAYKSEVLLNLIDTRQIISKANESYDQKEFNGNFIILSVGRLVRQKGIDVSINAAKILKNKGINFRWYVIGDGELQNNYKKEIKNKNLQDFFILLGRKENPYPYIKNCDLFIQSSRHEGYSISIIEAKALCKPILVSDIPSNREQITDGYNGFLFELDDTKLAEKIEYLYNNKKEMDKVSANLKSCLNDFTSEYDKIDFFINS